MCSFLSIFSNCSILSSYHFWPGLQILMSNFILLPDFPFWLVLWSSARLIFLKHHVILQLRIHKGSLIPISSNPHFSRQLPRSSRIHPVQCLSRYSAVTEGTSSGAPPFPNCVSLNNSVPLVISTHTLPVQTVSSLSRYLSLPAFFPRWLLSVGGAYISLQGQGHRPLAPLWFWMPCVWSCCVLCCSAEVQMAPLCFLNLVLGSYFPLLKSMAPLLQLPSAWPRPLLVCWAFQYFGAGYEGTSGSIKCTTGCEKLCCYFRSSYLLALSKLPVKWLHIVPVLCSIWSFREAVMIFPGFALRTEKKALYWELPKSIWMFLPLFVPPLLSFEEAEVTEWKILIFQVLPYCRLLFSPFQDQRTFCSLSISWVLLCIVSPYFVTQLHDLMLKAKLPKGREVIILKGYEKALAPRS